MNLTKCAAALAVVVMVAGCHSVTIRPDGIAKRIDRPDFEESRDFWVFGLVKEQSLDVRPICGSRKLAQMQTQSTFVDALVSVVTLGIYTPRSIRVWCQS